MTIATAQLMTAAEVQAETMCCVYSPAEAAKKLRCSEAAVRREAKRLGVKRIAGRVVAGFVVWQNAISTINGGMAVKMAYAD